jgi:thymidylate synthase
LAEMRFEPLHYPELLHLINPMGDVGIVTLWTPRSTALRILKRTCPAILDPHHGRIAVISNLYGDGLYAMLCNLLYNPQVRHIVAIGERLKVPTCTEIESLLANGVEETTLLGARVMRISGTNRVLPAAGNFQVDRLRANLTFRYLGEFSGGTAAAELPRYIDSLPAREPGRTGDRVKVDEQQLDVPMMPSDPIGHQVQRACPLDCWEELVTRCMRFGRRVTLRSGPRLELLNVKTVISQPAQEPADVLSKYGFSLSQFRDYQAKMFDAVLPHDLSMSGDERSYTYGNRLRGYFDQGRHGRDTLATVIDALRMNPESRRAFISLWDTAADLAYAEKDAESGMPCLVTLYFRKVDERLTLTATYRSHNLLTAWLENVYGLMAIQGYVAEQIGMPPGQISVISHSLGIDPRSPYFRIAHSISEEWKTDEDVDRSSGKHSLREDPNGYFRVTVDEQDWQIVAEHWFSGILIKRYTGDRAAKIERKIIGDMAVSLVSHGMWLARELMAKEAELMAKKAAHSG